MSTSVPTELEARPYAEALDAIRAELAAVAEADLEPINTNLRDNVVSVLGALPNIRALRGTIAAELPTFDLGKIDKLETYARAAGQAHADWVVAKTPSEPIVKMSEELVKIRGVLVSDAEALAKRNLIDGSKMGSLKGAVGYANVAFDVLSVISLLRANWAVVSANSAVKAEELVRAEQLVDRLNVAVGTKKVSAAEVSEAAKTRQRAYTLFVNAYDQVRRAISYLRWGQDAAIEAIAPSLHGPRNRKAAEEEEPEVDDTLPITGGAATPPAAQSSTQSSTQSTTPAGQNGRSQASSTGMPDESPLMNR